MSRLASMIRMAKKHGDRVKWWSANLGLDKKPSKYRVIKVSVEQNTQHHRSLSLLLGFVKVVIIHL